MATDGQSIPDAPRLGYTGEPHGPAYEMWREEFCRRVMAADLAPLSDGSFHCDVKALMLPQATISFCNGTPIRFMTLGASDTLALLIAPELRAARLLRDPLHRLSKISELAYLAGFNDVSYFHRSFRRRFGMTPSDAKAQALEAGSRS